MSVLSVVKDVCLAVGVNPPTSLFGTSVQPRTQAELLSLANEMAVRITADNRDWTRLKKTATFYGAEVMTTDPVTGISQLMPVTAFDLPTDYRRMPVTANVWKGASPLRFIPDADEWLQRRINNLSASPGWGEWTMFGGQMHIYPPLRPPGIPIPAVPQSPEAVAFVYISKLCVALASGGFSETFMADGDQFVLDERLLKLAMVWQWKANKGSPYAEDMGTYSDALVLAMGADSPAPIIIDATRPGAGASYANVW